MNKYNVFYAPCAVNNDLFQEAKKCISKHSERMKLGLADNKLVFLFVAGMNTDSVSKLEPLMDLYRMSHRNIAPVLDFERCFTAGDIESIVQILRTKSSNNFENYKPVTYCNYYGSYVHKEINMYDAQNIILKKLTISSRVVNLHLLFFRCSISLILNSSSIWLTVKFEQNCFKYLSVMILNISR